MGFAAAISGAALAVGGHGPDMSSPFLGLIGGAAGDYSLHDTYYVTIGSGLWLSALALYAGGVFWTLGYDTIYALQDLEDDAMIGVKSSARRLGSSVRVGVSVFYLLAIVCAALAGLLAGLGPLFYVGLTGYALHLLWQTRSIRADDGPLALALFKSNREAGLLLLLGIILGGLHL
jgi:4-hydroxybenzoate polyprenyltransferase